MTETDLRRALLKAVANLPEDALPTTDALADAWGLDAQRVARACRGLVHDGFMTGVLYSDDTAPNSVFLTGITSHGRRVVEESLPVWTKPMSTQQITIHNAQNLQVGDGNTMNVQMNLARLEAEIDRMDAPSDQKASAKGLLAKIAEHPLSSAIVGALATLAAR